MVISNVKGTFDKFDCAIKFDPDNIANSSVEVTIDVASIDTKDEKRDEHLRGEDFLHASKHPDITFVSKKIAKKGDGYVAAGTLTIRGVSKEVELPFVLNGPIVNPWGQTVIGIEIDGELGIGYRFGHPAVVIRNTTVLPALHETAAIDGFNRCERQADLPRHKGAARLKESFLGIGEQLENVVIDAEIAYVVANHYVGFLSQVQFIGSFLEELGSIGKASVFDGASRHLDD